MWKEYGVVCRCVGGCRGEGSLLWEARERGVGGCRGEGSLRWEARERGV